MFRFIGALLLVIGTTVGAGLLALPMVTVKAGLFSSIIFMIAMCIFMLIPAFYVIHVMVSQPRGVHLVTMAKTTLGPVGVVFLWVSNCFLLYAILAAYISAGGDLVSSNLVRLHIQIPLGAASVVFTAVMAMFVIPGIRVTGLANSVFMLLKASLYVILIGVLFTHMKKNVQLPEHPASLTRTLLVGVASFSYAMIIPSVYAYLGFNLQKLKRVVVTGTLISLVIYVLWIVSVRMVIPLYGNKGLYDLAEHGSVYLLAVSIGYYTHFSQAKVIANGFVSVCLLTTFLGVSICLSDVIADGLRVPKRGVWGGVVYLLTYLPPVIMVLFFPKIFVIGVNYAGLTCLIYLAILPALMIYSARYRKKNLSEDSKNFFNTRVVIVFILAVAMILFAIGLINIIQLNY